MNLLTTKRDPSTSLRLCKAIAEESDEREWDENKNRSKKNRKRVNPLTEVDVELVEGDMCGELGGVTWCKGKWLNIYAAGETFSL